MPVRLTPKRDARHGIPQDGALGPRHFPLRQRRHVSVVRSAHARAGAPAAPSHHRGREDGPRSRDTLGWFPDEEGGSESRLIVASAAAAHPAWYVNLARRPDACAIEVDGRRFAVNADSLHGPERDRAWKRIVALAPGYGKYEQQTDREIPVVRLTPRP